MDRRGVRIGVALVAAAVLGGILFQWSRTDSSAQSIPPDLKTFKAERVKQMQAAIAGVQVTNDIQYGDVDGQQLLLDAYLPGDHSRPRPAIILLHGGGWHSGDKKELAKEAAQIARVGWVAFSIDYRLDPFPAAADDVVTAVRWVRANSLEYGVDPTKIGILGTSAGGNLGALVGMRGSGPRNVGDRVAAVASWSGPMDLRFSPGETSPKVRSILRYLDCDPGACPDRYAEASPITSVDATDAPLFIANATNELVPLSQAQKMASRLKAAHVPYKLVVVRGAKHARGYRKIVWAPTLKFLEKYLGRLPVRDYSPPRGFRVPR